MEKNYVKITPKMAINLANPPSWAASVMPSVFGIALCYAYGLNLPLWKAPALVLCCILMQSAVNTLNDYFDYVGGTDSIDDVLEPSDAVLLYNNINPKDALFLGIAYLALGAILGIICALGCGLTPFILGIIGGLCVIFYTGGKLPISSLPIGELVSGLVMGGFIPAAIFSIAKCAFEPIALVLAIPFIISIGLIMMTNNCCDIEKDIAAGRKTLPTILGREKTVKLYRVLARIWKYSIWVLPILAIGSLGIFAPILLTILTRNEFKFLCTSPLTQENRINQMKGILAANIKANSVYIIFFAVYAFEVWSMK